MCTGLSILLAFLTYCYLVAAVTSNIQLELHNFNAILNFYTLIRIYVMSALPYHEIPFMYVYVQSGNDLSAKCRLIYIAVMDITVLPYLVRLMNTYHCNHPWYKCKCKCTYVCMYVCMSLNVWNYPFQRSTMNSVWETQSQSCAVCSVSSTACHLVWCTITTVVLAATSNSCWMSVYGWEIQVNSGYTHAVYAILWPFLKYPSPLSLGRICAVWIDLWYLIPACMLSSLLPPTVYSQASRPQLSGICPRALGYNFVHLKEARYTAWQTHPLACLKTLIQPESNHAGCHVLGLAC